MNSKNILIAVADLVPDKGKTTVMSNDYGESDVTATESETTCTAGNLGSRAVDWKLCSLPWIAAATTGGHESDAKTCRQRKPRLQLRVEDPGLRQLEASSVCC